MYDTYKAIYKLSKLKYPHGRTDGRTNERTNGHLCFLSCFRSWKIKFGKLKIGVTKKIIDFSKLDFQLNPIITSLILDQLAYSLPKTNTTFHQVFKYVKKDAIFPSIRWENSRNIFGPCSLIETVFFRTMPCLGLANVFFW